MQITIDTNNLSEMDLAILVFLTGPTQTTPAKVGKTTPAKAEKTPPAKVEAESEPEAPTMSDAVAAATVLVSNGGAAKVKAALAVVDVKRVSEMKAEDIPAFLAALEA